MWSYNLIYFINTGMFAGIDAQFLQINQVAKDVITTVMTNQDEFLTPLTIQLAVMIGKLVPTSLMLHQYMHLALN